MRHGDQSDIPEGPISTPTDIRTTPYHMPAGFEWGLVDVHDTEQLQDLYKLLSNNYVEDDDALFRFDYSPEFLLWALTPPEYSKEYLIGVKSAKTKKLVAFISGIPTKIKAHDKDDIPVVEINFLCVHKKLRSKRLAPVLIKEMTRRANVDGIFQAVYTAGTLLPGSVASARYYHRSLNPKKLLNVGFSRLPPNGRMTVARMCKIYALPEQTQLALVPMTPQHVPGVHQLLKDYLPQFKLHVNFTQEEVAHWLLPRAKVIESYVVVNADGKVTDLASFYHLPSTILQHNDNLHAAYSFYNIATSAPLSVLMKDALILAKNAGSDVFNALDLMQNETVLEELKFGIGDGTLNYYIYNWSCPEMIANQVGLVLL